MFVNPSMQTPAGWLEDLDPGSLLARGPVWGLQAARCMRVGGSGKQMRGPALAGGFPFSVA